MQVALLRAPASRNKPALRLPVASIKPVSKVSPAISRLQAKNKRCALQRFSNVHTRASGMFVKASSVMSAMEILYFSSTLSLSLSLSLSLHFSSFLNPAVSSFLLRLSRERASTRSRRRIIRIYAGIHIVSVYNYAKAANYRRIN